MKSIPVDWLVSENSSQSFVLIGAILILIVAIRRYVQGSGHVNMKITRIFVHPIKSCRGTSVISSEYTPQGLKYDRMFVIIDKNTHKTITARELPKMVLIHPLIHPDEESPTGGILEIHFPESSAIAPVETPLRPRDDLLLKWPRIEDVQIWASVTDAHVVPPLGGLGSPDPSVALSKYMEREVLLVYKGLTTRYFTYESKSLKGPTAFQDGYPILIASEESLQDVQRKVELSANGVKSWAIKGVIYGGWSGELVMERFRPNIVLEGAVKPYAEEGWEEIGFENGGADSGPSSEYGRMVCISRCTRCQARLGTCLRASEAGVAMDEADANNVQQLPNIEPSTGEQHAHVPYKVLAKYRRIDPEHPHTPCFGVNAVPSENGVYRVGDVVRVKRYVSKGKLPLKERKGS